MTKSASAAPNDALKMRIRIGATSAMRSAEIALGNHFRDIVPNQSP